MMKNFKELDLLDRFLFAETMEDPEALQILLEIILGKDIILKYLPQTEKEERRSPLKRCVRVDVWAKDEADSVYDTEVQKKNTGNLPKRSRYYQSMIDSGLLKPGEIDFNQLNDVFIIVISPFDLFGKGRYVYSFGMNCKEDQEVWLEDGAVRIFLNTHGKDDENITPELKELLHYMEHSDSKTNSSCMSEKIHRLHGKVQAIKDNEEVGVRYMQEWEERAIEIKEAREEARKEEKKNTERERRRADQEKQRLCKVNQLNKKLAEEGRIEDIVKAASDTEYQQQLIDKYNL